MNSFTIPISGGHREREGRPLLRPGLPPAISAGKLRAPEVTEEEDLGGGRVGGGGVRPEREGEEGLELVGFGRRHH